MARRCARARRLRLTPALPAEETERSVIYICIPAHNEGQTVGVVLWKVREVMREADRDYQILVADDASTDKTPAVLEPYTRALPLTVMRSEERRGYGASLEMLLREAVHRSEYPRRDVIIVLQADFTEDPDHILTLLKRIESGADAAISSVVRTERRPFRERVAGALERFILRGKSGADASVDPLEGYHAFRVSAVRRAFEQDTLARLLPWHGRAANAALLRAVIPHARRVDVAELMLRPERRQRGVRQTPRSRLREAWAFARGQRPADVLPVSALAPATVRTARTADHEVSVAALRGAGVTRAGENDVSPRRRRKTGGSGNGKARAGVKDGRNARGRRGGTAEEGREKGKTRRRSRSAADGETKAKAAEGTPEADAQAPQKDRPRRSRRRRRPSSGSAEATLASSGSAEPTDAIPAEESAGGDERERRRRRRGRRGGRRRSGRSRGAGESPQDASPDEPPAGSDAS